MSEDVTRKLTAILAADVAGYSRLMGEDEAGTRARFRIGFTLAIADLTFRPAKSNPTVARLAFHRRKFVGFQRAFR